MARFLPMYAIVDTPRVVREFTDAKRQPSNPTAERVKCEYSSTYVLLVGSSAVHDASVCLDKV